MHAGIDIDIHDDPEENCAYVSGSNLFADFEHSDAAEMHARSQLLRQLFMLFRERKLSDLQVAEVLGVSEAEASELMCVRINEFSTSQLFAFLDTLNYDAEITIRPRTPMKKISLRRTAAKARR